MALLQVRDFPQDVYALLAIKAQLENRSITQQTIHMLKEGLTEKSEQVSSHAAVLNSISQMNLTMNKNVPSPAELIRQDRDRQEV